MSNIVETFYADDNFRMEVEREGEVLFVHCSVYNYSLKVRKAMAQVFNKLLAVAYFSGWDAVHAYTKNPKFTKLHPGCFKIGEFEHKGEKYEVMRWELKQ